ncbi:MAG: PH domain-containing protein [Bacteroidales bacterium]|nr:PH domain-containing protein [Bacteroidales bacterium]
MSLLNHLLGNATEVDIATLEKEFAPILCENEIMESAYQVFRDKWIFTNKRLIMLDIQGVTGTKREYRSIPYSSITQFSIETAGTIDEDCEMKIWVKGSQLPIKKEFSRKIDVKGIQRSLASHLL